MQGSSEDRVLAGIAHLGIVVGWVGLAVALVVYLIRKDQSIFVGRHAKQALGYQICVLVTMQLFLIVFGGTLVLGIFSSHVVTLGFFGTVIVKAINLSFVALGVWAGIRAFLGEGFMYPVIGKFVDRI